MVLTTEDGTISPLDPVVHAFGSIEPLQSICLRQAAPIDSLNNLSNITIARISALPNLVHLKIFGFLLTDDNLEAMADELVDKLFLLELTLFCAEIGRVGFQALQAIVQENDNLASFRLFIRKFAKNEGGSLYKRFENVLHCVGKSKYKLFSLNVPNKFKTLCIEEVKKMIRGNTTIETVNMNRYSKRDGQLYKIQDDEVDFLVKMNKLGRGKLFHQKQDNEESKTDVTWGTMIEATGNDLSNIFSIVRSHPLEFAEMLSKDCTEEMPPTCKVMKILLKQQHHQLSRYFKQGFCTKEDFSAIIVPSAKTVQAVLKDNSVKLTTIIEKQVMEGTAQEAIKDALSCFAKENKEAIKTLTEELCSTKERLLWQTAGTQAKVLKTVEEAVQRNIQGDAEAIQCKLGAIEVQIKQNSQTFDKLLGRLEAVENGKSEAKQKQSVGVSFLTALLYLAIVVYGTISLSFMVFFCAIYFKTGIASASSF